ncbi:MAG: inositol monophosphatase family protein, partial [Chloroherpetonaceae bacterium]|nr:inositol monophosphatase family protein [Chloroherpetonaceae bacterium]
MTTDLEIALEAATAAGKLTLSYFRRRNLKVFTKRDASPVTEADRSAEKKILSILRAKFPKDGFLGEEFGEKPSKSGRRWIIDPIDGTKSFIHGVPLYGVMLGLEINGEVELGVIDLPALSETVYAQRGYGAFRNVQRLTVSAIASLSEATLLTSSESYLLNAKHTHPLDAIKHEVKLVRMWGDCWGHTLVAAGQADVMIEPKMSPWDAAALVPIIEEAGGMCFDY